MERRSIATTAIVASVSLSGLGCSSSSADADVAGFVEALHERYDVLVVDGQAPRVQHAPDMGCGVDLFERVVEGHSSARLWDPEQTLTFAAGDFGGASVSCLWGDGDEFRLSVSGFERSTESGDPIDIGSALTVDGVEMIVAPDGNSAYIGAGERRIVVQVPEDSRLEAEEIQQFLVEIHAGLVDSG